MDWIRKVIRITPKQSELLKQLADETGVNEGTHIRLALSKYLKGAK